VALTIERADFTGLKARACRLIESGQRRILGITGAPGGGKSTLAQQLVDALAPDAVLVPMDGFHLAEAELKRLGTHDRKGAIDTFDGFGFVALLQRLHRCDEAVVYAPTFRRDLEEPIAGAIPVPRDTPLVVTEGNYLLVGEPPWDSLRALIDDVWYVEPDEPTRLDRLMRRHMEFGRDEQAAHDRTHGSDQRNAELIASTKQWADVVVTG